MILALLIALPGWLKAALAGVLGVVIVTGVILWLNAREEADDRTNQEIGAQQERADTNAATLDNVRKANDAEEAIRRDPDARNANCLRYSRTPENCRQQLR